MGYALLADLITLVHFLFMAVVVVGVLLIYVGYFFNWQWTRNFWFRTIHLTMILIVVVEAIINVPCPLTTWETDLRRLANQPWNEASFTARVIHSILFWEEKSFDDANLVWTYYLFGGLVLMSFILVPPRWPRRKTEPQEILEPKAEA